MYFIYNVFRFVVLFFIFCKWNNVICIKFIIIIYNIDLCFNVVFMDFWKIFNNVFFFRLYFNNYCFR